MPGELSIASVPRAGLRALLVAPLIVVALLLVPARPAAAGNGMFVGAAEDNARSLDPLRVKAKLDLAALAGLGTVRMTTIWTPGETRIGGDNLIVLRNAAAAAQFDGIRLVVSLYHRDQRTTPRTSRARGEFAEYAASIARTFPSIRDFIVGNEPNLNRFWMPQFGPTGADLAAPSYELLLARTYDALKSVSPDVNVIGGALSPRGEDKPRSARPTHSPTTFIADLGRAYRATGRKRPIMDMFAIHPYLIPSRLPPSFTHPRTTTIGIADYAKLASLLTRAFARTGQRGSLLPIVYDEFGYQSQIPLSKRRFYTHLGSAAAKDAIPEPKQASYYKQALEIAQCQPRVAGVLIFHVTDERDARAWQSGLYYANDTPKSSLRDVRAAALAAQDGTLVACAQPKTTSPVADIAFHEPPATGARTLEVDFSCEQPCAYEARVLAAKTAEQVADATGITAGATVVTLAGDDLEPGSYQYALRVYKAGKPGTAVTRYSRPFDVAAPAVDPPPPADPNAPPVTPPEPQPPPAPAPALPTLVPTVPAAPPSSGGS